MAALLQSNKQEKWLRVSMLAKQGSITWETALLWYFQYCQWYESVARQPLCCEQREQHHVR